MPLTVKSINGDTSFLLTFTPPIAPRSAIEGLFPGALTILIDPWITGSADVLSPKFATSKHKKPACVSSLKELPEPDLILISQDKPDHCHEETLRSLPDTSDCIIIGTPAAVKKILGWNLFDPSRVLALAEYAEGRDETVFRMTIPPPSPSGSPGEITVALMSAKRDISNLHNAIGITYRPPTSVLSAPSRGAYLDLPPTPPASPQSPRKVSASIRTLVPSPFGTREKTMSVIYSPHGVAYKVIRPYASSHLVSEAALPLTVLLHSFDRVENPWYLGGNIATGSPGGVDIATNLLTKTMISAHDADKEKGGVSVKMLEIKIFTPDEVRAMMGGKANTEVMSLDVGQETRIES